MQRTQQDPADLAYQLGVARALNKQYEGMLEREQAQPSVQPRTPGVLSGLWTAIVFIACVIIGMLLYERLPGTAVSAPLPTAAVMTATARPAPTQERPQGGAEQSSSADSPSQPAAAYSGDVRELVQTPTPQPGIPAAGASEAEIQEWLDGPVSTETPLPEPGEAGFAESFQDAPACSPFVGYLAGDPCVEILKQQAGE